MLDLSDEAAARRLVAEYAERIPPHDRDGPWAFDQDRAVEAVLFYPRHLTFTRGEWAGRPFVLVDWQARDIIIPAFGWLDIRDGTRRYRRVRIWVPRKNGKTELIGGVGLMHLVCDGEAGAEVYSIATKEDQARICFDAAKAMVRRSPSLGRHVHCFADSLWCDELAGVWRPLAGIPKGSHGKGASALLNDELHEQSDDRLYKFLADGMGARRQPMDWAISTAGEQSGFGWEEWNTNLDIKRGVIDDPRTLVAIYAADKDDDWQDPATWAKANPNLGISVKRTFLDDQFNKARRLARHENDFKRYHLNIWTGQSERWLKIDDWDACGGVWRAGDPKLWESRFDDFRGRPCTGGVDLASTTDTCAAAYLFPPAGPDPSWAVLVRFWLPLDDLEERCRLSRVPFDQWIADGAIVGTPGNAADHEAIEVQLRDDCERFQIERIGFDPWNAAQMMIRLNAWAGRDEDLAVKVSQTMLGLSGASKALERHVLRHGIDHGGHPVLRWMASNVAVVRDEKDNIMPAKKRSAQKIDGIAALVNAQAVADTQESEQQSYLASGELLILA